MGGAMRRAKVHAAFEDDSDGPAPTPSELRCAQQEAEAVPEHSEPCPIRRVSHLEVAKQVAASVMVLAEAISAGDNWIRELAAQEDALSRVLPLQEAIALLDIISSPCIQCVQCGRRAGYSPTQGRYCGYCRINTGS